MYFGLLLVLLYAQLDLIDPSVAESPIVEPPVTDVEVALDSGVTASDSPSDSPTSSSAESEAGVADDKTGDGIAPIVDADKVRGKAARIPIQQSRPTSPVTLRNSLLRTPSRSGSSGTVRSAKPVAHRLLRSADKRPHGADTVAVVPRVFLAAFQPWLNHRADQGHRIVIVDPDVGAGAIQNAIRQVAKQGGLRYVVLVGDSEPRSHIDPVAQVRNVPAFLMPAKVNIKWGSEPEIATDNPYADLDDDGIPDVAIGRIPANSPAELERFVQKVIDYERQPRVGPWQRKVNFVAGVGDFGLITDAIIESTAKRIITNGIRPEYDISMTYGSWRSPYCPDPRRFRDVTIDRLNEGSLFWVYIGHGQLDGLDEIRLPNSDQALPIFEQQDLARLRCLRGQPIAMMLACYTGAFDHSQECLGEQMVISPGGPIAVIAGSRVTMPYAMAILGTGMLDSFFGGGCQTVGDLLLKGKHHLAKSETDKIISRKLLDSMARAIHADNDDMMAERREHLLLFNLLGDPLLRIPTPKKVKVSTPTRVTGGKTVQVRGSSPIKGTATVELVCRRDHMRIRTGRRLRFDGSEGALARMNQVYRFANDKRWSAMRMAVQPGRFHATFKVPDDALGHAHVRVAVQGQDDFAVGTHDIYIQPPKNLAEAAK